MAMTISILARIERYRRLKGEQKYLTVYVRIAHTLICAVCTGNIAPIDRYRQTSTMQRWRSTSRPFSPVSIQTSL
jgi:hypothetical protein